MLFPRAFSRESLFFPLLVGLTLPLMLGGCASIISRRETTPLPTTALIPPPAQPRAVQTGRASWYGPGFHGNMTSSGEIYNQHDLTAAHPTLPLGSRAVVTNLNNGKSVEVRINDRGPFVKGRTLDLSYAAARTIGLTRPGTAPVRIEVIPHHSLSGVRHRKSLKQRMPIKRKRRVIPTKARGIDPLYESRERMPPLPEELSNKGNGGTIF